MRVLLLAVLLSLFVGLYAWGDQPISANQGAPGKQGPWPVTCVSGCAVGPTVQDVNVVQYGGAPTTLGQKTMAASMPVVISSNQSAVPASQSGVWSVGASQVTSPWVVSGVGDFNNASIAPTGTPTPASATYCGFNDGVNLQGARTFDVDTGAGVQNVIGANIRVAGAGGSSEAAAGAGATTASTLRVVLPTDQTAISVSIPANQSVDLAQVAGVATVNGGLGGTLAVGGTQANDTAITANPMLVGFEALSTQPVAATTGNIRRGISSVDGVQYTRLGGPVTWTCSLDDIGATLTQCQPAPGAGLRLYLTDISIQSTTSVSGDYLLRTGTGADCGTGTTSLLPAASVVPRFSYPGSGPTAAPGELDFTTPISAPVNTAICIICVITNTCVVQLNGFIAP